MYIGVAISDHATWYVYAVENPELTSLLVRGATSCIEDLVTNIEEREKGFRRRYRVKTHGSRHCWSHAHRLSSRSLLTCGKTYGGKVGVLEPGRRTCIIYLMMLYVRIPTPDLGLGLCYVSLRLLSDGMQRKIGIDNSPTSLVATTLVYALSG